MKKLLLLLIISSISLLPVSSQKISGFTATELSDYLKSYGILNTVEIEKDLVKITTINADEKFDLVSLSKINQVFKFFVKTNNGNFGVDSKIFIKGFGFVKTIEFISFKSGDGKLLNDIFTSK